MDISLTDDGRMQFTDLIPVSEWVTKGSLIRTGSGVMIVHKVNRVNYLCYDEAGVGWNIRIAGQKPLDPDTLFDKTAYLEFLEEERKRKRRELDEVLSTDITLGTVVKVTNVAYKNKYPDLYAVIACRSNGTFNMAKIGGDGGRYLRGFKTSDLEIQDI